MRARDQIARKLRHWATVIDGNKIIGYMPPDHEIVHLIMDGETITIITKRELEHAQET